MNHFLMANKLKDEEFRRLTGVKRSTFNTMVEILNEEELKLHKRRGRYSNLSIEDRLLLTLEYLREYRTMFHISVSYGVSKGTVSKIITWVENTLAKVKEFKLPGKKELLKSNLEYEVFLIDATESPIERPKKKEMQKQKK